MNDREILVAITAAVLLGASPSPLGAQVCNGCPPICGVGNVHLDDCGIYDTGWSGSCVWYCHHGTCTSSHQLDCGFFADFTPSEIDRVVKAAEINDVEQLAAFLLSSDQVHLHIERKAIQIGGCNGELVASITISDETVEKLRRIPSIAANSTRATYLELAALAAALPR